MPAVQELPERSPLCRCLSHGYGRCAYHAVDSAEGNALSAAVEAHMRHMGMDPDAPANEEIRNQIGIMLQPAMSAYLDAFIASPGFTVNDVRAFLKEHPSG